MMKGLLYKEFYLTRKTYLSFLCIALVVSLICILTCVSMLCGNLRNLPVEDPESVKNYANIFMYTPFGLLVIAVTACNQSVYSDYATGWMKYSYTLPVKAACAVGTRYLAGGIILGFCAVYGALNAWIISVLTEIPIRADVVKNMLCIWVVAIMVCLFIIPLALKFKTAQAVGNRVGIIMILAYIALAVGFWGKTMSMSIEESDQYMADMMEKIASMRDTLLSFSPLIILIVFGISFFCSIKLYQRREK